MKKKESKFILINVNLFRCHVLITWEEDKDIIFTYANKEGVKLEESWKDTFKEATTDAIGSCMNLNVGNTDIIVWLKKRPIKLSEYGVLYHELHHAVGMIAKQHNFEDETEAMAYTYEYLVNEAHEILW